MTYQKGVKYESGPFTDMVMLYTYSAMTPKRWRGGCLKKQKTIFGNIMIDMVYLKMIWNGIQKLSTNICSIGRAHNTKAMYISAVDKIQIFDFNETEVDRQWSIKWIYN